MTIAERKEREKIELKELILLKAKELVDKEGYDALSIRRIAAAAEYSPATIYLYFKDKDEILHELMEMGFNLMTQNMQDAFSETDAKIRVFKIGLAYTKFGIENPEWYHIMFQSEKPMNHLEKCKQEWCEGIQLFDFLTKSCEEIIATNQRIKFPAKILALHLWSVTHGIVSLIHSQRLDILEGDDPYQLAMQTIEATYQLYLN